MKQHISKPKLEELSSKPVMLQRACACGQHTVAGAKCEQCRKDEYTHGHAQRAAISAKTHNTDVTASVQEVLRTPGQPLDQTTRAFMEPRFAYNFSSVPAHAVQESTHAGLTIGPADDVYEQEADRIANAALQQP